jgi:hypothetical protein
MIGDQINANDSLIYAAQPSGAPGGRGRRERDGVRTGVRHALFGRAGSRVSRARLATLAAVADVVEK